MYNMLLCTRSVPVLAEIVIVGHSRWRMSCRPVRHTGHLARQPLVEGGRGRVLLSWSLLSFFLLTKSCAQVVLLTITGSHSNSGRSQSSSPFLSSPQLGTRGSTTAYFHRRRCGAKPTSYSPPPNSPNFSPPNTLHCPCVWHLALAS